MKISKKDQAKNKIKILKVAVDLIGVNGYKKTSMRKIAKEAKIAEATIYNYFPTKEHIVYEYFYNLQKESKKRVLKIEEFNTFSLKEQVQVVIDIELELLKEDRAFVIEVFNELFYRSFNHPTLQKGIDKLLNIIEELIEIAIEAEEISHFEFNNTMKNLFINYYFGVIYYWAQDNSENFDNTTIMVDKSLDLIYATLQSQIIQKATELFSFLIKTHILNYIKPNKKYKKRGLSYE